jgi:OOP family OmpA-OmpF porin
MHRALIVATLLSTLPATARAQLPWDAAKQAAGKATVGKLEKSINKRLLEEGRANQCSFKTDTAELEAGCDQKIRRLSTALVDAKKKLNTGGVTNFKFVVSGHTDTTGSAEHNRELSARRAAVIERELVAKGVPQADIESIGMGASKPLVKPDDTAAKKARNRRYELQVKL